LPVDSADEIAPFAQANGIDQIFLVSPVTTQKRLDLITSKAAGFIYLLSRLGVTGTGDRSASDDRGLSEIVAAVKARTDVPVMAGFGISSAANAKAMYAAGCDGVISGSKVIDLAAKADGEQQLEQFYTSMLNASSYDSEQDKSKACK
jgi:tryptophan synthase alpha chain